MIGRRARVVWYLTVRWLRRRANTHAALILVPTFMLLTAVFISVSALTLTAEQQADSRFGGYARKTFLNIQVGDLARDAMPRAERALSAQVPGSHLSLETDQIRPDSFAKRYVQAPLEVLRFVEDPDLRHAFPGRYSLVSGSWPTRPLDVAVSPALRDALPGREFTALSGRVTMRIVGVVEDKYAEDADIIVAGPGTFASIPRGDRSRSLLPVTAEIFVFLGSRDDLPAVARALEPYVPRLPGGRGLRPDALESGLSARSEVENTPVTLFGTDRYAVSYLPLALVAVAASALVVAQTRRSFLETARRLTALGIRRPLIRITQTAALLIVCALAIAAGLVSGWLVAAAMRAWVLPRLADQPLSPVPEFSGTAWLIVAGSLMILAVGTLLPESAQRTTERRRSRWFAGIHLTPIRWTAVVLLLLVAAARTGSGGPYDLLASYLIVTAVILVAPDALRLVIALLPRGRALSLVTAGLARADFTRLAVAVMVIACCVGAPIVVGTQLVSRRVSDDSFAFSRIPAGQIWVSREGGAGPAADLAGAARAIADHADVDGPVVVRIPYLEKQNGATGAEFTLPQRTNGSTALMIVPSVDDVEAVISGTLAAETEKVVASGGVLDFTGAGGPQQLRVYTASGRGEFVTAELPTRPAAVRGAVRAQFAGAILLSTARELGLPIGAPDTFIFPDASQTQIADAVQAVVDAGFDTGFVLYQVDPPPATLPTVAYAFLVALVVGAFVVLLTVLGEQARRLRGYAPRLVALGLSPRWNLALLLGQAAIITALGVAAGVSAGILGVRLASESYPVVEVPTVPILFACLATTAAAALATLVASRSVTARQYHEVN